MRHLSWIVTLPFGLLVLLFALSNRGTVGLGMWPLPDQVELPIYLVGLAGALVGFLAGGLIAFLGGGRTRRRARELARRVERLEAALDQSERAERTARAAADAANRPAISQSPGHAPTGGRLAIGGG